MQCIRDYEQHKIYLKEGTQKLIEFGFAADEFVMIFYTNQKIVVSPSVDPDFYQEYQKILSSTYDFSNSFSSQTENKIIWFSDGSCNLEDEWETNMKSRLFLEKEGDTISFSVIHPFLDQNPNMHIIRTVIFSPSGNGFYSCNKKTGFTFQDDIVFAHQKLLEKKKQKIK